MLYHLLIHQEIYHDDPLGKPRKIKHIRAYFNNIDELDEKIKTIIKVGYEVRKNKYFEGG
jgi:DNA-binding winged helix-turn-helix (wHTH) protein